MAVYVFKGIEMFLLMGFTGFSPEANSPARKILEKLEKPEGYDMDIAIKGLRDIGMLSADEENKLHPTKEAAMLIKIFSEPSQVTGIRRAGVSGKTEYFLLKLGSLYCLYLAMPETDFHILRFPLDEQMSENWFEADILEGLPKDLKKISEEVLTLDITGNVLLSFIHNWYGIKAAVKIPLIEEDMWFLSKDLIGEPGLNMVQEKLITLYSKNQIEEIAASLLDAPSVEKQLCKMVEERVLISKNVQGKSFYCYSEFMKMFMDPVLIRDLLVIKRYYPENKASVVYLKSSSIFAMTSEDNKISLNSYEKEELKKLFL
jgi:hypothetical protein